MSVYSMYLDCSKLLGYLFPRDADKNTNSEGVFPVVATETVMVVLKYWARIFVLQGHTILNVRYSIFNINLGDQSSSRVGFLTLPRCRVSNHSLTFRRLTSTIVDVPHR